jgi:HSP20 family protein
MRLIRYHQLKDQPWDPLGYFPLVASGLGGHLGGRDRSCLRGEFTPPLDIYEEGDGYLVVVEIPDVKREQINIALQNRVLTISGERSEARNEEETQHNNERFFGAFSRSVTLPAEIDGDSVKANHKNGLLTIRLMKSEKALKREIAISEN